LRIAGGLLLLLLSIDMVFARQSGIRSTTETETEEAAESADVAIFPLAVPLIAGPGAITSIILLMERAESDLILQAIVIALMLSVLGLCLAALLFAAPLMDRLGVTGINVIGRVFGIVLAALAVQYIIDGTTEAMTNLPGEHGSTHSGRIKTQVAPSMDVRSGQPGNPSPRDITRTFSPLPAGLSPAEHASLRWTHNRTAHYRKGERYVPLWKRTKPKPHTASLLAKPTQLNINLRWPRFSSEPQSGERD
jgi:MarC family integral membrane protein